MKKLLIALTFLCVPLTADATLTDLHNGFVHDSINGILWTQNANLSPPPDTWFNQVTWADNLEYAGLDDFFLPSLASLRSLYNQLITLGLCKPPVFGGPDCTGSIGPFTDIQVEYWSGTRALAPGGVGFSLPFWISFANGQSSVEFFDFPIRAWAVHAAVPEPPAWLLMGFGVIVLARVFRREPLQRP